MHEAISHITVKGTFGNKRNSVRKIENQKHVSRDDYDDIL